ncbi:MAG TPA: hypothetical protein VEC76_00010 [Streptosporangiaceae bacterium]|nr:hypothetical protein [Streptosporangiaceae bacterium]
METDLRAHSAGPMALAGGPRAVGRHAGIGRLPVTCPGRGEIATGVSHFPFASGSDITGSPRHFSDTFGSVFPLQIKFQPTGITGRFAELMGCSSEPAGRFPARHTTIVSPDPPWAGPGREVHGWP